MDPSYARPAGAVVESDVRILYLAPQNNDPPFADMFDMIGSVMDGLKPYATMSPTICGGYANRTCVKLPDALVVMDVVPVLTTLHVPVYVMVGYVDAI